MAGGARGRIRSTVHGIRTEIQIAEVAVTRYALSAEFATDLSIATDNGPPRAIPFEFVPGRDANSSNGCVKTLGLGYRDQNPDLSFRPFP